MANKIRSNVLELKHEENQPPDIFPLAGGKHRFISHGYQFNLYFFCQPFCAAERKRPHQERLSYIEAEFLPQLYKSSFIA